MALPVAIIPSLVAIIAKVIGNAIDKAVPNKDAAAALKAELTREALRLSRAELQGAIDIILAEARGESWLQRNWRPILMMVIVAIVGNNYLIAPYINAMFGAGTVPALTLPERLWDLMTVGVGGYVAGRSVEKGIREWRRDPDDAASG